MASDPFADLREALDLSGANPFLPKEIDPILVELVRKYAPMRSLIQSVPWDTNFYYFNQRTGVAEARAVTETGEASATNSTYVQKMFPIRHVQTFGNIGDFARKTTKQLIDLRESEIRSATQGLAYLEETFNLWGNSRATGGTPTMTATGTIYTGNAAAVGGAAASISQAATGYPTARPQWDGLDTLVATNVTNKAGGTVALTDLDGMIDSIETVYAAGLQNNDYFFVMSPRMRSKLAQGLLAQQRWEMLAQDSRDNVANGPMGYTNIAAGMRLMTYRDLPILPSSFLSNLTTMGTVAGAASGSGSGLSAATYLYKVSVVSTLGESAASNEVSVTPTAGQIVTLSWTFPTLTDALGNGITPLLFKVYRTAAAGSTGTESLVDVIPAKTGPDGGESNTTGYVDLGGLAQDGVHVPLATGEENVYLVPRDKSIIVAPVVTEPTLIPLAKIHPTSEQFAIVGDKGLALRAEPFVARLTRVKYS